jgi:hypothetical protein
MPNVVKCLIRIAILIQTVRIGVDGVSVPQPYDIDAIHPRMGFFDPSRQNEQETSSTEGGIY